MHSTAEERISDSEDRQIEIIRAGANGIKRLLKEWAEPPWLWADIGHGAPEEEEGQGRWPSSYLKKIMGPQISKFDKKYFNL